MTRAEIGSYVEGRRDAEKAATYWTRRLEAAVWTTAIGEEAEAIVAALLPEDKNDDGDDLAGFDLDDGSAVAAQVLALIRDKESDEAAAWYRENGGDP